MGGGPVAPSRLFAQSRGNSQEQKQNPSHEGKDPEETPFTVLVTGFERFPREIGQDNTSHLITKLLPSSLTIKVPLTSERASGQGSRSSSVHVRILNPTAEDGNEGVPVEYSAIRSYVAELYDKHVGPISASKAVANDEANRSFESALRSPEVDLFLHVGLAAGWDFISVERCAYKQGFTSNWLSPLEERAGYYMIPDNARKTILNAGPTPWPSAPFGLSPSFDVDRIVEGANKRLAQHSKAEDSVTSHKGVPIKAHNEPGSYCCGFIYYESLVHSWIRNGAADVLFCHVPGQTDRKSLHHGRNAIVAVIEEAVLQVLAKRQRNFEADMKSGSKL